MKPGQTLRENHEECQAGEDRRGRLYITRLAEKPWVAVWFCHNCGGKGSTSLGYATSASAIDIQLSDYADQNTDKLAPEDVGVFWSSGGIPPQAVKYLSNYHITERDAVAYNIGWDEATSSLVYPHVEDVSSIKLPDPNKIYQRRALDLCMDGDLTKVINRPKYLTYRAKDFVNLPMHYYDIPTKKVVIVEDYLSAIRIMECQTYHVLCLWGSHLELEPMLHIVKNYDEVTVWLDNDLPVEEKALHMTSMFRALGVLRVGCVWDRREPKHAPTGQVLTALRGVKF